MNILPIDSPLQLQRLHYQPKIPAILSQLRMVEAVFLPDQFRPVSNDLQKLFPLTSSQQPLAFKTVHHFSERTPKKVGVVLSGGQAAGGHNVIIGLLDALNHLNMHNQLFGFIGGPSGILTNTSIEITAKLADSYRNQGGFDMIGSGRTKIETPEQFEQAAQTVQSLQLDALVVIGGDDSNTNAALLAEYFKSKSINTQVIGVPKTIDGDLKNEYIEISFGFDTACKVYADLIGNIARDALSAKKYYHFIKIMGRSASHIALECSLQTHPNLTLIGEEILAKKQTLQSLTQAICDVICQRSAKGMDYGIILLPEGLIEFIPEFKTLIQDLNTLLAPDQPHLTHLEAATQTQAKQDYLQKQLSQEAYQCFAALPALIQEQLLMDRDPHGNVQVSKIETERLFIATVTQELDRRKQAGIYKSKFNAQPHFLGYEGRSCFPSNFDSNYCYALGHVAALLIESGVTGYMCTVKKLASSVDRWECGGVPLVAMIGLEQRHGKTKPVISKALVDLQGKPFTTFEKERKEWIERDLYRFPGPIQFNGLPIVSEAITRTLELESIEGE